MSGKPQETQTEKQADLIEQIITQGLEQMMPPTQAQDGDEAEKKTSPIAKQEHSADIPPAKKKNRRSSVYLYLFVLFAAAFLLLLLAYFIQQRSSEDTISDLRYSMNLSRQELLDEIKALQDQNNEQVEWIGRLNGELSTLQEQYEEKEQEATDLQNQIYDIWEESSAWKNLWLLEQYYQAEDYESCAAVLILLPQSQFSIHVPDIAQERYEEIVQAVIDAGILEEDYAQHPETYKELLENYISNHYYEETEIR